MKPAKLKMIVNEATTTSNEQNYGENIYMDITETTF